MTKISIVIPIYNPQPEHLQECLNSISQQSHKDLEIILINNACTKSYLPILSQFQQKDKRAQIIRFKKNMGYAKACNAGIAQASGEYLLIVDSDDIISTDACRKLISHLTKHPSDVCFFPFQIINSSDKQVISTYTPPTISQDSTKNIIQQIMEEYNFAYHQSWNKIYNLAWLKENHITFDDKLKHIMVDKLFTFTCIAKARKMSTYTTTPLYSYRTNGTGSICSKLSQKNCNYLDEYFVFFKQLYNLAKTQEACFQTRINYEIFTSFISLLKTIHHSKRKAFCLRTKKLLHKYNLSSLNNTKYRELYNLVRDQRWKNISLYIFHSYQLRLFNIPLYKETISETQNKISILCGLIKITNTPTQKRFRIFKISIKHNKNKPHKSIFSNLFAQQNTTPNNSQLDAIIGQQKELNNKLTQIQNELILSNIKSQMINMHLFDEEYYLKTYPNVSKYMMSPIDHYLKIGANLGYNPSEHFNSLDYIKRNPNIYSNPLYHFLRYGRYNCCCLSSQNPYPATNETIAEYKAQHQSKSSKVVYTCLTGQYDQLITHRYLDPTWDYICFTDNTQLLQQKQVAFWQIRPLARSDLDNVRLNRYHKLNPHIILPEYEESIYIDGNINILTPYLFELIKFKHRNLLLPKLNFQDCIYQHIQFIRQKRWDDDGILSAWEQVLKSQKFPQHYGMTENNIIYRKHNLDEIQLIMSEWWKCIEQYSKRDQLSFSYILWKHNIKIKDISFSNAREDIDNFCIIPHEKTYILH